jgi:pimeloyl-ACP methyl ester carboxylesterase
MLDDLVAFVDALDLDPIVLVGQSMGGINALLYAATTPERVDRLVLGDIGPEIAREGLQRIRGNVAARDTFSSVDDALCAVQVPRASRHGWPDPSRVGNRRTPVQQSRQEVWPAVAVEPSKVGPHAGSPRTGPVMVVYLGQLALIVVYMPFAKWLTWLPSGSVSMMLQNRM